MGKRGPGASRQRLAREQLEAAPKRRMPWKARGLTPAQRTIRFIEWLPDLSSKRVGKRVKLLPFQKEFIEHAFAEDRSGHRKIDTAILSTSKGGGKTAFTAWCCLSFLVGPNAEELAEIYAASISKEKAGRVFKVMKNIIHRVPEFNAVVNIVDSDMRMEVMAGDGLDTVFTCLAADSGAASGLVPLLWLYDEAGEAPDGELLSVLLESAGKRPNTLGIVFSTQAASDDHSYSKLIDDALTGADPATYIQLHAAPKDADIFSDETIRAANPAAGHFLDIKKLFKARDRARRNPSLEAGYRRLRLNQRVDTQSEHRIVSGPVWKQCAGQVDREKLKGRVCFGGLDLASKHDLTAFVLVFPSEGAEPSYDVLPIFWTPRDVLETRKPAELERFREWDAGGFLRVVNGPVVRAKTIAEDLTALAKEFKIKRIGYDKWKIDDLKLDLSDLETELPLEGFGQGQSKPMLNAIEFFQECAVTSRIRHGGHPVLTASVVNAIITPDKAGNPMIDKPKSNRRGPVRVDGAVALVMAFGTARHYVEEPPDTSIADWLSRPPVIVGV